MSNSKDTDDDTEVDVLDDKDTNTKSYEKSIDNKYFNICKISVFVFFIYIFINCDIFTDKVLSGYNGLVEGNQITNKGVCVQAILITLSIVALHLLVDKSLI